METGTKSKAFLKSYDTPPGNLPRPYATDSRSRATATAMVSAPRPLRQPHISPGHHSSCQPSASLNLTFDQRR
eukprot:3681372-Pyramimonas_sp.AAC.1